jgi:hypothetical protein
MVTRTIKLFGQGFGNTTELLITANGTIIHEGEVDSIPGSLPLGQYTGSGQNLVSFEVPGDFVGQIPISITVQSGSLITTDSFYNYTPVQDPEDPEKIIVGPDIFGPITTDEVPDPKINVLINGISQTPVRRDREVGEWYWAIPTGMVLTFDLIITIAAIELLE